VLRKIVQIDEEKCDGCGLCADACAEGAIQVVDGKARLVSDTYCDGLGACIGECPSDAITIIEREAAEFDEEAVQHRMDNLTTGGAAEAADPSRKEDALPCGCPGSMVSEIRTGEAAGGGERMVEMEDVPSQLRNWPVQLRLVPVNAPYLQGANLLLAADCVPFSLADFHRRMLEGKILLIGCPKLDDAAFYLEKLTAILMENDIRSLAVAYMEVPCCFGLVNLARQALEESGKDIPFSTIKVGIRGELHAEEG
jgi:Pyruvate/2-oxoacid:ferredoxin oxidoreductase delta subunit